MRSRKQWLLWIAFALGALLLRPSAALRAEEGSGAASASVELPSGLTARYEYHFNRNAIRDSRRVGDALIAVTESGNLLRFDLETRMLVREWFGPSRVVCLGRGEGDSVLAGLEDGRVCRVDPATLGLEELASLPGKPRWVGFSAEDAPGRRGLVVVFEQARWVEQDGQRWRERFSVVYDLATGKSYAADGLATAFLLDHRHRLWLGADRGEWGGWCACVDLKAGALSSIRGLRRVVGDHDLGEVWSGVYGFVELRDGQVWAFGGMSHMGFNEAFVRRVDQGTAEELYRAESFSFGEAPGARMPERPVLPITHILEGQDDELLVFAYGDLFRTDVRRSRWTRIHELNIRYHWGRPDAVGSYPAVTAVHRLEGQGVRLLCATALDGYVLLDDGEERHSAISDQLGTDDVERVESSEDGMLFREWTEAISPWRFHAGTWRQDPPDPDDEAEPVKFGSDEPPRHFEPSRRCRDGLGRLWIAYGGLWMFDPASWRVQAFGSLPMMGQTRVTGVYADRDRPGGVVATLEGRGVVFVRVVEPRP